MHTLHDSCTHVCIPLIRLLDVGIFFTHTSSPPLAVLPLSSSPPFLFSPSSAQALLKLRLSLTGRFIRQLCFVMRAAAGQVAAKEDWVPVLSAEALATGYDISSFPLSFGDTLAAALDQVTE